MQIPAIVGKYELLEFLGGGMSHVYRGRDTVIDRPVVVKLLTVDACQDAEAKARFLQEARLAGNIQHENIVSVFDFGEHDGRPFIVMEFLKGEDLRDAIRGGRTGSLFQKLKVAQQIADALEYVNGRGIVHRDIKPENVHIDTNGRVKLMDFGIAKTADLSLTKTGMTMGTPYYMAPEQVAGRPVTAQADVYAFGLLLYELLTGVRGVNGETIEAVLFQILNQPLDPAPMVSMGVPPEVRSLVMRCVEKKAEDRPPGFSVIVHELRGLMASAVSERTRPVATQHTMPLPVAVPPPNIPAAVPAPTRVKSRELIWGALAAVLIAGGTVWFATQRGTAHTETTKQPPPHIQTERSPPPPIEGMVYFPSGTFSFGPQNIATPFKAFYIDETEVSNADFAEYCRATGCAAPEGIPDLPVVRVTVAQARAYAAWKGKRLPTAVEWEYAARGTDVAKYPWGDAEDPSLANVSGAALKPVKSYSPYRMVYQMAGNAWEMVDGEIKPSERAQAVYRTRLNPPLTADDKWIEMRGGSFKTTLAFAVAYEFVAIPERFSSSEIGFRCAKSVP